PLRVDGKMVEPSFNAWQRYALCEVERGWLLTIDTQGRGTKQQDRKRLHKIKCLIAGVAEIVEQRQAIRLRPDTDHSGIFESLIIPFNGLFPIERDGEMISPEIDPQGVPIA